VPYLPLTGVGFLHKRLRRDKKDKGDKEDKGEKADFSLDFDSVYSSVD
jgi:hypothetical protein